jgi:hypothetical protein
MLPAGGRFVLDSVPEEYPIFDLGAGAVRVRSF